MLSVAEYYGRLDSDTVVVDENLIRRLYPVRSCISNKGDYGKLLILAGSPAMTGAAILSARAALRGGTGLVRLACDCRILQVLQSALFEPVFFPVDYGEEGLAPASAGQLISEAEASSACLIGPGLGTLNGTAGIVRALLEKTSVPKVIDADALNIAARLGIELSHGSSNIITPHPGEFSRLTGLEISCIQSNRIKAAREFSASRGVITVLKGAYTIITTPAGRCYINTTGNSGLAKGGSGDVLAGLMASLLASGSPPEESAVLACYLHGLAADSLQNSVSRAGMTASDIIEVLPSVEKHFEGQDI